MHASRIVALLALGSSLAVLPACGSATTEPAQSAQSNLTRAPLAAATQLKGPERVIAQAFADVPLRPEQRSEIEQMFRDASTRHEPVQKAWTDFSLALAQQVDAGTIDKAALQPKIDAIAAERAKVQDQDRAAIERAHALLTPDQRVALIDSLEATFLEKGAAHVGAAQLGPQHIAGDRVGPQGRGMGMKQWADDLKLTDDQRSKIEENMHAQFAARGGDEHDGPGAADGHGERHHRFGGMKEHWDQFKAAFESDHFVMDEVAPKRDVQERAQKMSGHLIDMASAALPVLTPEQRTIAATKLREHAQAQEGQ